MTNSGTPAFPTTFPENSKAAAIPASARLKSPSTARLPALPPFFPWIFTGGIDPFLWFPIPGIQTLNFIPYRVNLTPFAGILSNGQPHTVSLSVFNADSYFSATASLLVYLDPNSSQVTGAITTDTLAAPNPVITENINAGATISGTVDVTSNRSFTITGYANTSAGKITTKVYQSVDFHNNQYFDITDTKYTQNIKIGSTVNSTTTTSGGGLAQDREYPDFHLPLHRRHYRKGIVQR